MSRQPPSRRDLLRAGAAAVAGTTIAAATTSDRAPPAEEPAGRRRGGMVIDLDRCTACGSCTIACRQENNVPPSGPDPDHAGRQIEWMSILWQEPEQPGSLPTALPFPCQQCAEAPCVKVCPVGATLKSPEGITLQIWDRCIGCRYCMVACPYGRRSFNWETPRWSASEQQMLNPDVATRPHGVVEKCTFCHHRIRRVKEEAAIADREVTDEEVQRLPACAAACPAEAIVFGDLHDPDSRVARLARDPRRFQLLDHLGTDPGVIYLKRDRR
jgi:molybdopterin-containing oxidoreductase family iron-sulfur binding subunit